MTERLAYGLAWEDSGYVFTRPNGLPVIPQEITKVFTALVRENGLPHLTLHGLRHAYASLGLQAGVEIKVVSQSLGHSTIGITSDLSGCEIFLPVEECFWTDVDSLNKHRHEAGL